MTNSRSSARIRRMGHLFLIAVLIGVFFIDVNSDPVQAYGTPVSDAVLKSLHGTSNEHPQRKNAAGRVLWTNCADANRGDLTQTADCDGRDGTTPCIYCTEPERQPLVDDKSTVATNGYHSNGQTTCTGVVYLGKCVNGQCANGVAQTQSCAANTLLKYLQQAPGG